jgi:hypothetical protein
MLLTSQEIKSQLLDEPIQQVRPPISKDQRAQYIEIGQAVKRMAGSKGWKIVEAWLLRKLDVNAILNADPGSLPLVQAKAQAYAEIFQQVNYWIKVYEQFESENENKPKEE